MPYETTVQRKRPRTQRDYKRSADCITTIAVNFATDSWLPLTPRTPRERVQRHERRGVRAIIFPSRISGIARKVPPASAMMVTHCANSLKILERSRFGPRYLVSIEVKRCHPT